MATNDRERQPGELAIEIEAWKEHVVEFFIENGETDRKLVEAGVTWGELWIEESKGVLAARFPDGVASRDEMRQLLLDAKDTAAGEHTWLPRYPGGAPSLRASMIANETFLITQGDDAEEIRALLLGTTPE